MNYEVIFNEKSSTQCMKDQTYNKMFIDATLRYYRDLVACRGYVFLNDILSALGLENIQRGQTEGWKKELQITVVESVILTGLRENNAFVLTFTTEGNILDVFKN